MKRATRLLAALLLCALAPRSDADDLGGEGFGVPTGPPWAEARERLVVQIRPAQQSGAANAIFRQDIPFTRTALVLAPAEPGGEPTDVTLADALAWQKSGEELFEIALENLDRRFPASLERSPELKSGVRVNLLFGSHPFAAAYALSVENREECMGKKGALVAVPNQHATLCYPIESSRASHAYLAMVDLSANVTGEGANPLVPHVYWYHGGSWDTQPVTLAGDKQYDYGMTPEFRKLLEGLPRDIHDPRRRRY